MAHEFMKFALLFLGAAVLAVPLATRSGLGSILGYLIAGAVIGPYGLRLFSGVSELMHFSEFGVVFLLFVIGLELKPSRLWVMRKAVFGLGGVQVALTTVIIATPIYFMGLSMTLSFAIGFALSLSSTAFALQYLSERKQLSTDYGRSAFAILLFQDVAVIPILALLPIFFVSLSTGQNLPPWVGLLAVVGILVLGRVVTRPLFQIIAQTRSREVFTAATLLLVLGVASVMSVVGLSMALGAFLVGVILSDSEYRHELETDIEPFKGLLLGLFFMSVGMMVNLTLIIEQPLNVFGLLFLYLTLKFFALFVSARLFQHGNPSSRSLSFAIIQGSEFAFVIISILRQGSVLNPQIADYVVLTVALSMAMTPVLGIFNDRVLAKRFEKPAKPYDDIHDGSPVVIIAGLGRFGQIVSRVLKLKNIAFTALEHDPLQVETLRRFGNLVYYGDASRIDLLEKAGAHKAKYFILAIDDVEASVHTATIVRQTFPHLKIFARARNRAHEFRLKDLGIEHIERETFWSSLYLTRDLLQDFGVGSAQVQKTIEEFSRHDRQMLEGQYQRRHNQDEMINYSKLASQQLAEVMREDSKIKNL